jgi:uncharacterized protein
VTQTVLIDTGPLIAFLSAESIHREWVKGQWQRATPPFFTCEPVFTAAAFLLKRERRDTDALFDLLERGTVQLAFNMQEERAAVRTLMHRYANRPMSLADACLVRMSEMHRDAQILTFDSDFRVYRRHGNKVIPLLTP